MVEDQAVQRGVPNARENHVFLSELAVSVVDLLHSFNEDACGGVYGLSVEDVDLVAFHMLHDLCGYYVLVTMCDLPSLPVVDVSFCFG